MLQTFGDLTQARTAAHATSNGHGGLQTFNPRAPELYSPTGKVIPRRLCRSSGVNTPAERNIIDFITISSDGNSVDFGDLSSTLIAASSTRGLFMGGFTSPGNVDTISYVEISTILLTLEICC